MEREETSELRGLESVGGYLSPMIDLCVARDGAVPVC